MKSWKEFVNDARNFNLSDEQLENVHDFYEKSDPDFFDAMLRRIPGKLPEAEIEEKYPDGEYKKFYFLLIASSWDYMAQLYKQLRYPVSMLEDIRNDFRIWTAKMIRDYGYAGLNSRILDWCNCVLSGRILQFGRLQSDFPHAFAVKAALLREQGTIQVRYGETHQSGALLEYGDPVINIHIPEAGPLKKELCLDSLRRIAAFAEEFRPYYNYRAVVCYSWVLDPVFAQMNPKSNLADFQKLGHLFAIPGYDETNEVLWRVFDAKVQEHGLEGVVPVTTMQKNVLSHIKAGGKFSEYCLVILKEELPRLLGSSVN